MTKAQTPHATQASNPSPAVIAMLTYLRPEDLRTALPALLEQIAEVDHEVSILVVDNDPDASAMSIASEYPAEVVRFVHEPAPGIASARNRAIEESSDKKLLIFIDDDERPEPHWLKLLIETWQRTTPAAVVGPVVSTFPKEPDPWIVAGAFFDRRRLPTGTSTDVAATNNLLLDMDQIRAMGVRFDIDFGASGGSDTMFTRQIDALGGRMVWCDEAVVVDVVPVSRMSREWVLRRYLRTGNAWSRTTIALETTFPGMLKARLSLTFLGVARIVGGLARLLLGMTTRSLSHRANGSRTLVRGIGMTLGAWGLTYFEYRRKSSK